MASFLHHDQTNQEHKPNGPDFITLKSSNSTIRSSLSKPHTPKQKHHHAFHCNPVLHLEEVHRLHTSALPPRVLRSHVHVQCCRSSSSTSNLRCDSAATHNLFRRPHPGRTPHQGAPALPPWVLRPNLHLRSKGQGCCLSASCFDK